LQRYEHAPPEVEWIYVAEKVPARNTIASFWQVIGPGHDGETGRLALPFNPDYDKDYGEPTPAVPLSLHQQDMKPVSLGPSKDSEKPSVSSSKIRNRSLSWRGDLLLEGSVRRRSSSAGSIPTEFKSPEKRSETLEVRRRQGVRLFEYPNFAHVTFFEKHELNSERSFVRLLSHPSQISSSTLAGCASSLPSSVNFHVWIGKSFDPQTSEKGRHWSTLIRSELSKQHKLFAERVSKSLESLLKLKCETTKFFTFVEEEGSESREFLQSFDDVV